MRRYAGTVPIQSRYVPFTLGLRAFVFRERDNFCTPSPWLARSDPSVREFLRILERTRNSYLTRCAYLTAI